MILLRYPPPVSAGLVLEADPECTIAGWGEALRRRSYAGVPGPTSSSHRGERRKPTQRTRAAACLRRGWRPVGRPRRGRDDNRNEGCYAARLLRCPAMMLIPPPVNR